MLINKLVSLSMSFPLSVIILFIVLDLAVITGSLVIGIQIGKTQTPIEQLKTSKSPTTTPTPSPINTTQDSSDWNSYNSDKFGFSIQYPSELHLLPKEIDIKSEYLKYINKCSTGVINGCGGFRWPDFYINFVRPDGEAAFGIQIYQMPVNTLFGVGGVERDRFTYLVQTPGYSDTGHNIEPLDDVQLKSIEKTLRFYKPSKPLACLWERDTMGPGFDLEKDKSFVDENRDKLSQVEGYSFNVTNNTCSKETYLIWSGQVETDKPPFTSEGSCLSTCLEQ